MNTIETLVAVRELLTPPENWTRGANARDPQGITVAATSPNAVCWCLQGAAIKVANNTWNIYSPTVDALSRRLLDGSIIGVWQDRQSHADVLAFLDEVITAERAACT